MPTEGLELQKHRKASAITPTEACLTPAKLDREEALTSTAMEMLLEPQVEHSERSHRPAPQPSVQVSTDLPRRTRFCPAAFVFTHLPH